MNGRFWLHSTLCVTVLLMVASCRTLTAFKPDPVATRIAVTLGAPVPLVAGQIIDLQVSVEEGLDVAGATLAVNGEAIPLDNQGKATYKTSAAGVYTVTAQATDASGKVNANELTFTAVADKDAPVVTLTAPSDPVEPHHKITINLSAIDNVAVESLTLMVNMTGAPGGIYLPFDESGSATYTPFHSGEYTLDARATDPSGNVGTGSVTFDVIRSMEPHQHHESL